jgi:hypothetical protein
MLMPETRHQRWRCGERPFEMSDTFYSHYPTHAPPETDQPDGQRHNEKTIRKTPTRCHAATGARGLWRAVSVIAAAETR